MARSTPLGRRAALAAVLCLAAVLLPAAVAQNQACLQPEDCGGTEFCGVDSSDQSCMECTACFPGGLSQPDEITQQPCVDQCLSPSCPCIADEFCSDTQCLSCDPCINSPAFPTPDYCADSDCLRNEPLQTICPNNGTQPDQGEPILVDGQSISLSQAIVQANNKCDHNEIRLQVSSVFLEGELPPITSPVTIVSDFHTIISQTQSQSRYDGFRVFSGPFTLQGVTLTGFTDAVVLYSARAKLTGVVLENCQQALRITGQATGAGITDVEVRTTARPVFVSGAYHSLTRVRVFGAATDGFLIRSAAFVTLSDCVAAGNGGAGLSSSNVLGLVVSGGTYGQLNATTDTTTTTTTTTKPPTTSPTPPPPSTSSTSGFGPSSPPSTSTTATGLGTTTTAIPSTTDLAQSPGGNLEAGLRMEYTFRATIVNAVFQANGVDGLFIGTGSRDISVLSCGFGAGDTGNSRYNLRAQDAEGLVIGAVGNGNRFEGDAFTMLAHIHLKRTNNAHIASNFFGARSGDVFVDPEGQSELPSFSGIHVEDCGGIVIGSATDAGGSIVPHPSANTMEDEVCENEILLVRSSEVRVAHNFVGVGITSDSFGKGRRRRRRGVDPAAYTVADVVVRVDDLASFTIASNTITARAANVLLAVGPAFDGTISDNTVAYAGATSSLPTPTDEKGDPTTPSVRAAVRAHSGMAGVDLASSNIIAASTALLVECTYQFREGVDADGSVSLRAYGNRICVDEDGTTALSACKVGVNVSRLAGDAHVGVVGKAPNLIYGRVAAVVLEGSSDVENNYIGVDKSGASTVVAPDLLTFRRRRQVVSSVVDGGGGDLGAETDVALPEVTTHGGLSGIFITGSASLARVADNVVGGFATAGIHMSNLQFPFDLLLTGNLVGTDKTGLQPLPNWDGLRVDNSTSGVIITGFNVFSGNLRHGVYMEGVSGVEVRGAVVGLGGDGLAQLGNEAAGIHVRECSNVQIGQPPFSERTGSESESQVDPSAFPPRGPFPDGNIVGSNGGEGILFEKCEGCGVQHSYVGLSFRPPGGTQAVRPNELGGVVLDRCIQTTLTSNTISGNKEVGVAVRWSNSTVFEGNFIGTAPAGLVAVPNEGDGVELSTCEETVFSSPYVAFTLQGPMNITHNVVSGNMGSGVVDKCTRTRFEAGHFGLDVTGLRRVANMADGLRLMGEATVVGALAGEQTQDDGPTGSYGDYGYEGDYGYYEGNGGYFETGNFGVSHTILCASGNRDRGIHIEGADGVRVGEAHVGLGSDGATRVRNGREGILVRDSTNVDLGSLPPGALDPVYTTTTTTTTATTAWSATTTTTTVASGATTSPPQTTFSPSSSSSPPTTSDTGTSSGPSRRRRGTRSAGGVGGGTGVRRSRTRRELMFDGVLVVGGNGGNGIDIGNSEGILIQGVQVGVSNGNAVGNSGNGIVLRRGTQDARVGGPSSTLLVFIANNGAAGMVVEPNVDVFYRSVGFANNGGEPVMQEEDRDDMLSIEIGEFTDTSADSLVTVPESGTYVVQVFAASQCILRSSTGQAERLITTILQSFSSPVQLQPLPLTWSPVQGEILDGEVVTATIAALDGSATSDFARCRGPLRDLALCSLCTCFDTTADCRQQLSFVPTSVDNTNITELLLGDNTLSMLPDFVLDSLPNLETLDMHDLHNLNFDADLLQDISGLSNLRTLNLSSNQLTSLPGFTLPPSLEALDLSNNMFDTNPIDFSGVNSLERLLLDDNVFEILNTGEFFGAGNLTGLSIRRNLIFLVEPGAFDGLVSLQVLDVSQGLAPNVTYPAQVLAGLTSLTAINWFVDMCPQGFVSAFSSGGSICLPCPQGTFAQAGLGSLLDCEPCAAGQTDDDEDSVTPCAACPPNTFTDPGSFGACGNCSATELDHDQDPSTPCVQCGPGTFANRTSLRCEACGPDSTDHDRTSETACVPCTGGALAPDGFVGPCLSKSSGSATDRSTIGAIVGVIAAVAGTLILVVLFLARRKVRRVKEEQERAMREIQRNAKSEFERLLSKYNDSEKRDAASRFDRMQIPRTSIVTTRELGAGEYGVVELGELESAEGPVAIKRLHEKGVDADEQTKFLQEARLMAILEHKHIVRLLGVCTLEPPFLMVLEYMGNGDLRSFLKKQARAKTHSSPDVLAVAVLNVAKAMAYLESKHIVHRDLAARNVLVADNLPEVKLADFGMSRPLDDKEYYRKQSTDRVPLKWMAPESIRDKTSTHASDVWSYGILCWEVFTFGQTPYPGYRALETIVAVAGGYRMPRPDYCPPSVYAVVEATWEADPSARPVFEEVCTMMREALDNIDATEVREPANSQASTAGTRHSRYKEWEAIKRENAAYVGDDVKSSPSTRVSEQDRKYPTRGSSNTPQSPLSGPGSGSVSASASGSSAPRSNESSRGQQELGSAAAPQQQQQQQQQQQVSGHDSSSSRRVLQLGGALWQSTDTDAGDDNEDEAETDGSTRMAENELYGSSDHDYLPLGTSTKLPPIMERRADGTYHKKGSPHGTTSASTNSVAETEFSGAGAGGNDRQGVQQQQQEEEDDERPYLEPVSSGTGKGKGKGKGKDSSQKQDEEERPYLEPVSSSSGSGTGKSKDQQREERPYLEPVSSGTGNGGRRNRNRNNGKRAAHKEREYMELVSYPSVLQDNTAFSSGQDTSAPEPAPRRHVRDPRREEREYVEPVSDPSKLFSGSTNSKQQQQQRGGKDHAYLDLMSPKVQEVSSQVFDMPAPRRRNSLEQSRGEPVDADGGDNDKDDEGDSGDASHTIVTV